MKRTRRGMPTTVGRCGKSAVGYSTDGPNSRTPEQRKRSASRKAAKGGPIPSARPPRAGGSRAADEPSHAKRDQTNEQENKTKDGEAPTVTILPLVLRTGTRPNQLRRTDRANRWRTASRLEQTAGAAIDRYREPD